MAQIYFLLFSTFDVFRISEALIILFYKFFLKWEKTEVDFESSIFFEAQKYYFVFESRLIFFSNGHIRNVVSTLPNLWKSTLKMTMLFRCCLTLFNSTLKHTTLFQRYWTSSISTLTYTTLFQHWFDVVRRRDVI